MTIKIDVWDDWIEVQAPGYYFAGHSFPHFEVRDMLHALGYDVEYEFHEGYND